MFLNPIMLAGIAGAALPLVVHLLSRARVRTVDWGAMMFLEEGRGTQEHAARLKQWTLLLLRMALVALLAIAMARPLASGSWAGPAGPVTAVIVVDTSASMAQPVEGGRTHADAAREAVLKILGNLQRGDRAALVVAGAGRRSVRDDPPTADLQAVATRAAELKASAGAADIAAALNDAAAIIDRESVGNAHLYLVCDAQASSWRGVDEPFQQAWRSRTARGGRPLPFEVIATADGAATDNIAIESIALPSPPVTAGIASDVEVRVRNFGASARSQLPLVVRAGKDELFRGTLDLGARGVGSANFHARFDAPGQQTLTAEVSSATLASDDRLDHVLDVVPPVRVLIVSGDEGAGAPGAFRGDADFLRAALAPFAAVKRPGADPAKVTVTPVERWGDAKTDDVDVLVLANVAELTPQQVRAVESFVYGGGGLLVAPGASTRPESYNRTLFRDGVGPLPASLAGPMAEQPTSLLGIELSHPIFRFLQNRPDPIPSAVVAKLFVATPRPGAAVLASYVTGQPFLIDGAYGRGRVLLMTTTIDADWNTLPLSSFYLPFVQSAVRYLAAAALPQRNVAPGQEIRARYAAQPDGGRTTLEAPDGLRIPLDVGGHDGNYEVTTADTAAPGAYALRATFDGRERIERFVVQPPLAESDLEPLDAGRWATLQRGLAFRRTDPTRALSPLMADEHDGRELWLPTLIGVLALAATELLLTRYWSEAR